MSHGDNQATVVVISGHHEKKCLIVSNPIEEGVKEKEKIFMFVLGK